MCAGKRHLVGLVRGRSEIWDTIGLMLASVYRTGKATWSEDALTFFARNLPREKVKALTWVQRGDTSASSGHETIGLPGLHSVR
jgi:hypothetical protein